MIGHVEAVWHLKVQKRKQIGVNELFEGFGLCLGQFGRFVQILEDRGEVSVFVGERLLALLPDTAAAKRLFHPGGMSVADAHDICDRLESALQSEVEDAWVTIHVEPENKAKHSGVLVLTP